MNINDIMNKRTNRAATLNEIGAEHFLEMVIDKVTTGTRQASNTSFIFFEGKATDAITGDVRRVVFAQNILKDDRGEEDIDATFEFLNALFQQTSANTLADIMNKKVCIKTYLGKDGKSVNWSANKARYAVDLDAARK